MSTEPEVIDSVRDLHLAAKERTAELQKEATNAARKERLWGSLLDYLHKGWHQHLLHLMRKESPFLKGLRAEGHPAIPSLDAIYRRASEAADLAARRFPAILEQACREAELEIDQESRHPRYYFEGKFLVLEIDEQRQVARLTDHEGRLGECPADVPAVVGMIQAERGRLFDRKFNGKTFLTKIRRNYLAVLRKDMQEDGAAIPIRHITRRLGKNLKGFRTDEFLVDLSRLVESGPLEIDGRRIDLQQTKDTSQGMLLHGVAGRGYIGFVTFRELSP